MTPLVNDGQMSATSGSAVDMGEGDDLIVNRGTMTGKVLTGAGNDEVINVSTGRASSAMWSWALARISLANPASSRAMSTIG